MSNLKPWCVCNHDGDDGGGNSRWKKSTRDAEAQLLSLESLQKPEVKAPPKDCLRQDIES